MKQLNKIMILINLILLLSITKGNCQNFEVRQNGNAVTYSIPNDDRVNVSLEINFNDGSPNVFFRNGESRTHTYTTPGIYKVHLTINVSGIWEDLYIEEFIHVFVIGINIQPSVSIGSRSLTENVIPVTVKLNGEDNSTDLTNYRDKLWIRFDNGESNECIHFNGFDSRFLRPGSHSFEIMYFYGVNEFEFRKSKLLASGNIMIPDISLSAIFEDINSSFFSTGNDGLNTFRLDGYVGVYDPINPNPYADYPVTTVFKWMINGALYKTETIITNGPDHTVSSICNYLQSNPTIYSLSCEISTTSCGVTITNTKSWNPVIYINNGSSGSTGATGDIGSSGYSGSSGDYGYSGSYGSSGDYGYSGSYGYTGSDGSSGYSGSSGDYGYSGSSGDYGYSGYTGSDGSSGNYGYTGSDGSSGYSGSSGDYGYSGSDGSSGYSGSSGDYGYSGYDGSSGYMGSSGDYGYSGYYGYSGSDGSSGDYNYSGYYRGRNDNNQTNNELKTEINILSNTILNVSCSKPPHSTLVIQVFDMTGKLVSKRQVDMDFDRIYNYDLINNRLKSGLYLVNVKIANENVTKKVLLQSTF